MRWVSRRATIYCSGQAFSSDVAAHRKLTCHEASIATPGGDGTTKGPEAHVVFLTLSVIGQCWLCHNTEFSCSATREMPYLRHVTSGNRGSDDDRASDSDGCARCARIALDNSKVHSKFRLIFLVLCLPLSFTGVSDRAVPAGRINRPTVLCSGDGGRLWRVTPEAPAGLVGELRKVPMMPSTS